MLGISRKLAKRVLPPLLTSVVLSIGSLAVAIAPVDANGDGVPDRPIEASPRFYYGSMIPTLQEVGRETRAVRRTARFALARTLRTRWMSLQLPIEPEAIARYMEIGVTSSATKELPMPRELAAHLYRGPQYDEIVYNERLLPYQRRLAIAREIYRYLSGGRADVQVQRSLHEHARAFAAYQETTDAATRFVVEADIFALEMVMPSALVLHCLQQGVTTSELATMFDVPTWILDAQLALLGLDPRAITLDDIARAQRREQGPNAVALQAAYSGHATDGPIPIGRPFPTAM